MTLLYVGAFVDTLPLLLFKNYQRFIFVDQAPNDPHEHWPKGCLGHSICQNFIDTILRNIKQEGHQIIEHSIVDNTMNLKFKQALTFKESELIYYFNTIFPDDLDETKLTLVNQSTGILIKGCYLDTRLLKNLPKLQFVYITYGCLTDLNGDQLRTLTRYNLNQIKDYELHENRIIIYGDQCLEYKFQSVFSQLDRLILIDH